MSVNEARSVSEDKGEMNSSLTPVAHSLTRYRTVTDRTERLGPTLFCSLLNENLIFFAVILTNPNDVNDLQRQCR